MELEAFFMNVYDSFKKSFKLKVYCYTRRDFKVSTVFKLRRVATSVGKLQMPFRNHPIDFKMAPPIENPADCEVGTVIRFLSFKAADIHRQISDVYGEDGRTNIHDEERSGRQ